MGAFVRMSERYCGEWGGRRGCRLGSGTSTSESPWGEGKLTNSQTVFISARFHFPELQHGVQQNKL